MVNNTFQLVFHNRHNSLAKFSQYGGAVPWSHRPLSTRPLGVLVDACPLLVSNTCAAVADNSLVALASSVLPIVLSGPYTSLDS